MEILLYIYAIMLTVILILNVGLTSQRNRIFNLILIVFSFFIMILSVFQDKIVLKITTETLILIAINFIFLNLENISKIWKKIKSLKIGLLEVIQEFPNEDIEDNEDIKREAMKKIDDVEGNVLIAFLISFIEVEKKIRKINVKYDNEKYGKKYTIRDLYRKIFEENRNKNLEKYFNFFIEMNILRNKIVHGEIPLKEDIDYKTALELRKALEVIEIISKELEIISNGLGTNDNEK